MDPALASALPYALDIHVSPVILVALIVAISSMSGPIILANKLKRDRLQEKEQDKLDLQEAKKDEDEKRQSERLADYEQREAVAQMARDVASQAQEAARLLAEENKRVRDEAIRQQDAVAEEAIRQQEAVANQAAAAAKLLRESNAEIAEITAKQNTITNGKLDDIHILVNSQMLEEQEHRLSGSRDNLLLMKEIIDLHRAAGQEPSAEALAALKAKETEIADLSDQVDQRREQADKVAAQEESRGEDPGTEQREREAD